jgi:hypothetical protein
MERYMPSLKDFVGKTIFALIPFIHGEIVQVLKLHGVEPGGIWVESQTLTDLLLARVGRTAAPKTAIFFLPYQQIVFVLGSLDVPSLSEKATL